MKILIVGQYYYPDNFRINEISQALAQQGHTVDMLTGLPDYATGKVPKEYKHFRKRKENIGGVHVIRVPIIARRTGLLWRALNYVSFMINSTIYAAFCKKDYDIIVSYQTSPITMANAALKMKKRTNKKLFLYCLDIWPECLKAWNVKESSFLYKMMHRYSRNVYSKCDIIGVSSRPFIDYLAEVNGINKSKIQYIPQHCEDAFFDVCGKNIDNGIVDFTFAGNIGSVQDVECIIRAVARLKDLNNFKVHILGDGSELAHCKELSAQLTVQDKLIFYGRIDHERLKEYYEQTDAFLLTLKGNTVIGKTMPAKLQEYMSLGKPVFAATDGASKEIIAQADCGFVVNASDDEALAQSMRCYIANPEQYRLFGENARNYFKKYFTKNAFMEQFNQIILADKGV